MSFALATGKVLADLDPVSGGAGWVGTGLLGSVLCWLLLKHLPDQTRQLRELTEAKDKQIETLIAAKDKAVAEMTAAFSKTHDKALDTFAATMGQAQASFTTRNDKTMETFATVIREERQTCQKWHEENRALLIQALEETKENRHYIGNLAHQLGLRKAADEAMAKAKREGTPLPTNFERDKP